MMVLKHLVLLACYITFAAEEVRGHRWGQIDGHNWKCVSGGTFHGCQDGYFYCNCPGRGNEVYFRMGCCKSGGFCRAPWPCHGNHNCDRFKNCQECHNGKQDHLRLGCTKCLSGLTNYAGSTWCEKDINECYNNNGGCDHYCHNKWRTYSCSCRSGYRLGSDRHRCEKEKCDFSEITNVNAIASSTKDRFSPNEKVTFTCDSSAGKLLVLVGPNYLKCEKDSRGNARWIPSNQPNRIQCIDTCNIKDTISIRGNMETSSLLSRAQGVFHGGIDNGISNTLQLGGCSDSSAINNAMMYARFHIAPTVTDLVTSTQRHSTVEGCLTMCTSQKESNYATMENEECKCHATGQSHSTRDEVDVGGEAVYRRLGFIEHNKGCPQCIHNVVGNYSTSGMVIVKHFEHSIRGASFDDFMFVQHLSTECNHLCQTMGYNYAGVNIEKGGGNCFCSHAYPHESQNCDHDDRMQTDAVCETNATIFQVQSSKLMGCVDIANKTESLKQLTLTIDKKNLGHGVQTCRTKCTSLKFRFASLKAGDCYCHDNIPNYTANGCSKVYGGCPGHMDEQCGSESVLAVYTSGLDHDISSKEPIPTWIDQLYDSSQKVSGLPTNIWSMEFKNIITSRLAIFSSEETQIPNNNAVNYHTCGSIKKFSTKEGNKLVLRFFKLDLSHLKEHVLDAGGADQVFVYAQTTVVSETITFPFALHLKTRQLVIDRSRAFRLDVENNAPKLDEDIDFLRANGPAPDILFLKLSFVCARILLETNQTDNTITAEGIMNDITSRDTRLDTHTAAFASSVRSFQAEYRGLGRTSVHYVPYYSKDHVAEILELYKEKIEIYDRELKRIKDKDTSDLERIQLIENIHKIFSETNIVQSKYSYENCKEILEQQKAISTAFTKEYENSRHALEKADQAFKNEVEEKKKEAKKKKILSILGGVAAMTLGILTSPLTGGASGVGSIAGVAGIVGGAAKVKEMADALKDILEVVSAVGDGVLDIMDRMETISDTNSQIEDMLKAGEELSESVKEIDSTEYTSTYANKLERTVALHVHLVEWDTFRDNVETIFDAEAFSDYKTRADYKRSLLAYMTWGKSRMKSAIHLAEQTRQCMSDKFMYDQKLKGQKEMNRLIVTEKDKITSREVILQALQGETIDIQIDLNNVLILFCQAYFYANFKPCRNEYQPSFGDDLSRLLIKITDARTDSILLPGKAPSSVSRNITITDMDTDPQCADPSVCPVNYFRKHRTLVYEVPIDKSELTDLDKFMVAEIAVTVHGASRNDSTGIHHLKMRLTSSGQFESKLKSEIYRFSSRAISLTYEYDLDTGIPTIRTDVYPPARKIVNYISPYTTWRLSVAEERSKDINLSHVTSVTVTFRGSALDRFGLFART